MKAVTAWLLRQHVHWLLHCALPTHSSLIHPVTPPTLLALHPPAGTCRTCDEGYGKVSRA